MQKPNGLVIIDYDNLRAAGGKSDWNCLSEEAKDFVRRDDPKLAVGFDSGSRDEEE